ncbi:MAG: type II toxin-antitoxin system VapC family toxin [Fimbriiglobus sp.]
MIYLDTNVLIRLIEGVVTARAPIEARLAATRGLPRSLITSRLARMECRVKPVRTGDATTLALLDGFFGTPELVMYELTPQVLEIATDIRAVYRFKTPDALHIATAVVAGASAFLTGDKDLARCTEVSVEVV